MLVQALERIQLALVGAPTLPELAPFGIRQFGDLVEARAALGLKGRVPKIDNVFHSVPVMGPAAL